MKQSTFRKTSLFSLVFLSVLLGGFYAAAQRELVPGNPNTVEKPIVLDESKLSVKPKRIREGTTFRDRMVLFRQTGARTTAYSKDGDERFVCLENLNLDRILKSMEEKPTRNLWKIDGIFTEFHGENYILIQRAVVAPEDDRGP